MDGTEETTGVNAVTDRQETTLAAEFRPMISLALPVVLSELGWIAMGITDTIMVGRLGAEAIGAVGIGNVIFFSVAIVGYGLLLGMDTLVSQAFGAGKLDECRRLLVSGITLAIGISVPLMLALEAMPLILNRAGIDPRVLGLALPYLRISNLSLPFLLVFSAYRRYLQGMNLVWPVMATLILGNLANLLGNWAFVYGHLGMPALGVNGSGWSTFGSRFVMALTLAVYTFIRGRRAKIERRGLGVAQGLDRMKRLLALGVPSAGHLLIEVAVFAVAAVMAGRFGAEALAAHEVVLQVASTAFMVPLGVSAAGAVRVGQAIGRGEPRGAVRAGWAALMLGAGFMTLSAATMLLVPRLILGIFTVDPRVLSVAISLLVAAALFQVFDGLQVVGTGILRGVGETRVPMYCNFAAHWLMGLPIGYFLGFSLNWGVLGLWIGLASGLIAAGMTLVLAWILKVRQLERNEVAPSWNV